MTRRLHGDILTAPDTAPAQCFPSSPADGCLQCWRRRETAPRRGVVIDASAIMPVATCVLFVSDLRQMRRAA